MSDDPLAAFLEEWRPVIEDALANCLPRPEGPAAPLARAMRYSVLGGGKRLRPTLVLMACETCGGDPREAIIPACAVELAHSYSLIHDDLPAMDDDDFRRGRPSCHRAFDEATAILAGDALLTLAFELLTGLQPAERAVALSRELAEAVGPRGMLAGQMADIALEGTEPTPEAVLFIHSRKTAALIAACARMGAIAADAPDKLVERLGRYGEAIGLAFQITDDALDLESTRAELGKTAGKDAAAGKVTYPAVFGLEASRERAAELIARAIEELEPLGPPADLLRHLARYVVTRKT